MTDVKAKLPRKLEVLSVRFASGLDAKLAEIEIAAGGLREGAPVDESKAALQALSGLAHRLAGSAGTFGFAALGRTALKLEILCLTIVEQHQGLSAERHAEIKGLLPVLRKQATPGARPAGQA